VAAVARERGFRMNVKEENFCASNAVRQIRARVQDAENIDADKSWPALTRGSSNHRPQGPSRERPQIKIGIT